MKRALMGILGALAVVGFAAAYVVPTGAALAEAPAEPEEPTLSLYSTAVDGAQELAVASEATPLALDRSATYTVYVTPKPTPKPTVKPASTSRGSSGGGGGGGAARPPAYSGGGSPAEWMAAAGIAQSDWGYVDYIASRESGWNPNATNPSSGACGLIQAYPCSKVPGSGYNPVDNLRWANGYAVGRYGSWAGAYAFWTANHWW